MKRWTSAGLIALAAALALFLIPGRDDKPPARPEDGTTVPTETEERQLKQRHLAEDVARTEQLCRTQCRLNLKGEAERLAAPNLPAAEVGRLLDEFRGRHDMMRLVIWHASGSPAQDVRSGGLEADLASAAEPHIREAIRALDERRPHESPSLHDAKGGAYVVLAEPFLSGTGGLIRVAHQDILREVGQYQSKNLRLEPYPTEKNWKIESVDADTGRDVRVTQPEHNEGTSHYKVDEIVDKFRKPPSEAELAQIRREIGASAANKLGYTYVFQSTSMKAEQLMDYFKKWNVEYAEPHYLYLTNETVPNDSLYARYQWNLPLIGTDKGWDISKGSSDMIVAVVDTGVDLRHPDLAARLVGGLNVINRDASPLDDVGHGTHVAGVISAIVNNAQGIAGISWNNPIMPVKALDSRGAGSTYAVAQGIIWATDNGARVINLSLGNYANAQFLHDAIKYAYDRDVVLIAATGNDNTEQPGYPAAYPEVLAVGATDSRRQKAGFSNFGDYVDVTAPEVSIASTYMKGQYAALSGTSMASPHAAALAALIRSVNPKLTNTEVYDIIRRTADDLGPRGRDKYYGYGQINVERALVAASRSAESLSFWSQWFDRNLERIVRRYS